MADYETASNVESAAQESSYTSQGPAETAAGEKGVSKRNKLITAAVVLGIVALLVVVLLAVAGSSSSSRRAESGRGGSGDDIMGNPSYVVSEKTSKPPPTKTNASTTAKTATTKKRATTKKEITTTTTTTQRPIPYSTLVCTFGPLMKARTPFPEDGVCDYTFLEEMPSRKPADLGAPYPPPVKHFIDMASKHRQTEYGVAFDGSSWNVTKNVVKDPTVKSHLYSLFEKRIFHFGYINTPTFDFNIHKMTEMLHILKRITTYLEEKKTPQRPIYTVMASTWSPEYDEVSAKNAASAFRTVLMPDLFISRAHLYDHDSNIENCKIMPANFLRAPPQLKTQNTYFFNMATAIKHIADLDKLRDAGVRHAALSLSVGLYGRWYSVDTDAGGRIINYDVGDMCFQEPVDPQRASLTQMCRNRRYKDIRDSKLMHCKYAVDAKERKVFAYDTIQTLRYKLCASRKNFTALKYGLTAVGLEFCDGTNYCGSGKFPMLSTVKKALKFYSEHYTSPAAYAKCLS